MPSPQRHQEKQSTKQQKSLYLLGFKVRFIARHYGQKDCRSDAPARLRFVNVVMDKASIILL